jgi:3-deoxy-D-manno-octulosonate 8-phosphate phosphatase (KDO 8-P phosphatase)
MSAPGIGGGLLPAAEFQTRLKKIKMLLLDVDGVLTDGRIFFVQGQGWTRHYNIYDGYGIKLLQSMGVPVGIISGGQSDELKERVKILKIEHAVLGSEDKLTSMRELSSKTGIAPENICFMGDELFDMPALVAVGLGISVPGAMDEVKAVANHITTKQGGSGAVREVIDLIRKSQNLTVGKSAD